MVSFSRRFRVVLFLLPALLFSSTFIKAGNETYRTYKLDGYSADNTYGYSFAPANDGNGYIILYHYSSYMFSTKDGFRLQKRDSLGSTVWCKDIPAKELTYSQNSDTLFAKENYIEAFYRMSDNNNIMVIINDSSVYPTIGATLHFNMISFTKFDDSGNFLWTKKNVLENNFPHTTTMTKFDKKTDGTYIYDYTYPNPYIAKFDSSGKFLWSKKFIDSAYVGITDILPLTDGSLFIIGEKITPSLNYCMYLDSTGNILWQRSLNQGILLKYVQYDFNQNNILIFGKNNSNISIIEIDSLQSSATSNTFSDTLFGNGSHALYPFVPLPENSFLLYIDTFYVILDSAFQTKTIYDAGNERDGFHTYMSEGPISANFINNKIVDIYSHYYDDPWAGVSASSSKIRELNLGGGECTNANPFVHQLVPAQLTLSPCNISDSTVFHLGTFDSVTFDSLVADTSTMITCLFDNIESNFSIQYALYPNPASSIINIDCKNNSTFDLEIYNALGTCIFKSNFRNQTTVNCSDFSNGIYFVKIFTEDQVVAKKFLIEK